MEGLHLPCTHNQSVFEVQLHRFLTVLDVVNRVLEIRQTHPTPGLTRKMCQIVLFHHDLIGSALISERCRTSRHLYLLSDFITHSSCRHGRNHRPFLPFATVCGYVSSGSCQERTVFQCLHEDHSSTPAERDGQETELVSAPAWKSTLIVRPSGSLYGIFCPGYVSGQACCCAPLSRSKYSAPACLLVDDTELSVTPMIHGSTLEMHESSPTTLGSCEGYDTVEAVSEG